MSETIETIAVCPACEEEFDLVFSPEDNEIDCPECEAALGFTYDPATKLVTLYEAETGDDAEEDETVIGIEDEDEEDDESEDEEG